MRQKRLFVVLAVLALVSLVGATAVFAGTPARSSQQGAEETGLVIVAVDADGPAAAAGVARGDILFSIDGQETNSRRDIAKALADLAAGDEVEVVVTHGDEERTLTVVLDEQDGRAYLGIQPYYGEQREAAPMTDDFSAAAPGALVLEVVADSPAEAAGLQAGDVIVAVNGEALSEESSLADVIGALQPGDEATLEVEREGADEALTLTVALGENPDKDGVAFLGVQYQQASEMTFGRTPFGRGGNGAMPNFHDWQFEMPEGMEEMPFFGQQMPFGDVQSGVVVMEVAADSPAEAAGLTTGDQIVAVDGVDVATPEEVVTAISQLKPGDVVVLSVQKTGEDEAADVEVTLAARPDDEARAFLGVSLGAFSSLSAEEAMPGQGGFQFQFPFGQDDQSDGSTSPFEEMPQSPEDLLEQLFPGLGTQQNS